MIILENTYMLESILKDSDNKFIITTLLRSLVDESIKSFEYVGTKKFNTIIEYDFSLIELKIMLKNNDQNTLYLKMIKGGKIKETIFCYWSLLYEEYLNNNKLYEKGLNPEKVIINENSTEENKKNITLMINKNINYSTEIALVQLKRYINEKAKENNNLNKLKKYEINDNDILFLGKIKY